MREFLSSLFICFVYLLSFVFAFILQHFKVLFLLLLRIYGVLLRVSLILIIFGFFLYNVFLPAIVFNYHLYFIEVTSYIKMTRLFNQFQSCILLHILRYKINLLFSNTKVLQFGQVSISRHTNILDFQHQFAFNLLLIDGAIAVTINYYDCLL